MAKPKSGEQEEKRRIGRKHLDDTVNGNKPMKPPDTFSGSAAQTYYTSVNEIADQRATGQRNATDASARKRTTRREARRAKWREMTIFLLKRHPSWEMCDVVEYIESQDYPYKYRTIAAVVAALVKQHKKAQLRD